MLRFKNILSEFLKSRRYIHCLRSLRQIDQWQRPVLETITADWDVNWDLKYIPQDNFATRFLMLVNHGEFKDNDLTNTGLIQAFEVAERINYMGYAVSYITHTGSERTIQTAEVIQENIRFGKPPLLECALLREAEMVGYEGAAMSPDLHYQNEVLIEAAFRKHFYRPDPRHRTLLEVFVAYPNIINYFICRGLQLSPHAWYRLAPPLGSCTVLTIDKDSVSVDAIGDVGHLDLEHIPSLP